MPLKVTIGSETHELNYEDDLKCSLETINDDLMKQPSLYAYYATLYEMAKSEYDDAERIFNEVKDNTKVGLEICEAELDAHFRSTMDKYTETSVKNAIKTSDIYSKTRLDLIEQKRDAELAMLNAKRQAGLLRAVRDAFAQRKDMLISYASNLRAQLDTDLILKEKHERELGAK